MYSVDINGGDICGGSRPNSGVQHSSFAFECYILEVGNYLL